MITSCIGRSVLQPIHVSVSGGMQVASLRTGAPAHSTAGCLHAPGLIKGKPRSRLPFLGRQAVVAMATTIDMSQLKPFEEATNWANVMPPGAEGSWNGYVGSWGRYDADGQQTREYSGIRLFRPIRDVGDDFRYDQTNIYSMPTPGSEPREQDGNVQKTWSYSRAEHSKPDGWFHPFMVKDGPLRSRALAPSPGRVTSACFGLPLPDLLAQHDPAPPFFGGELFFRNPSESSSWSGGPLFDTKTGALMSIFYIREYRVAVDDPQQPIKLQDHPAVQEARGKLPSDPGAWLDGNGWTGVQESLVYDEDAGKMLHSSEQPAKWTPPPATNKITLLPDLFYTAYPEKIPTSAEAMPAEGLSIEMGGLVSDTVFRRTVVSYGGNGRLASIRHDDFSRA